MIWTASANDAGPGSSPPVEGRRVHSGEKWMPCHCLCIRASMIPLFFHFENYQFLAIIHFCPGCSMDNCGATQLPSELQPNQSLRRAPEHPFTNQDDRLCNKLIITTTCCDLSGSAIMHNEHPPPFVCLTQCVQFLCRPDSNHIGQIRGQFDRCNI